jgi:hypothetical protein
MKTRYGKKIVVSDDADTWASCGDADVRLTIDGEVILLSAEKARKLAKKLKRRASSVDLANTLRKARETEGYL